MTDPLDKVPADVPPDGGRDTSPRKDPAKYSGPIKAVPVRHYGRWISAVVVLGLLALLVRAFADAQIQWSVVGDQITNGTFAWGAWETLKITVYSMVIGVVLGAILAVMRLSPNPVLSSVEPDRRATLVATMDGGGSYRFDIRLQGDGETVFFDV